MAIDGRSAKQEATLPSQRRGFLAAVIVSSAAAVPWSNSAAWANDETTRLIQEIKQDRALLEPLPQVLLKKEWDKVRTTLKIAPVGRIWNLGPNSNTIKKLGENLGDPSILELMEEVSSALQLADQFTYDNVFLPFQPGNGKVKIKEPTEQIEVAISKLDAVLKLAAEGR